MESKTKSIIDLTKEYNELLMLLMDTGGEMSPDLETRLTVNAETMAAKVDSYDFVLSRLEGEEAYWRSEADRYVRVARSCQNARERLKNAVKQAMIGMGITEINGDRAKFKLSASTPRLIIDDQNEIPSEFIIETVIREPNKTSIRSMIDNGYQISGCRLEKTYALRSGISKKED